MRSAQWVLAHPSGALGLAALARLALRPADLASSTRREGGAVRVFWGPALVLPRFGAERVRRERNRP